MRKFEEKIKVGLGKLVSRGFGTVKRIKVVKENDSYDKKETKI